jgi:transcriptional regulator with XRE-family HTH domain
MSGDELRAIRLKLGHTQEQFAALLNASTNHIARMERGERTVSHDTANMADKLAVVLPPE